MNPILQIIFKKRLLWIGLSLLGGLYAPLRAQTCPARFLYPVSVVGTPNSSYINNIIIGGADGVRVFALCKRPNSHFIKLLENEQNN